MPDLTFSNTQSDRPSTDTNPLAPFRTHPNSMVCCKPLANRPAVYIRTFLHPIWTHQVDSECWKPPADWPAVYARTLLHPIWTHKSTRCVETPLAVRPAVYARTLLHPVWTHQVDLVCWSPPLQGACVDSYDLKVLHPDGLLKRGGSQTPLLSTHQVDLVCWKPPLGSLVACFAAALR